MKIFFRAGGEIGKISGTVSDAARFKRKRYPVTWSMDWQTPSHAPRLTIRRSISMKPALATFIVLAAANTTFAIAQEGSGSGPPKQSVIVIPSPLPTPTTTSPTKPSLTPLEQR
jgi:hypothetical protein